MRAEELRRPAIDFWAARALVGSTRRLDTDVVAVVQACGLAAGGEVLAPRAVPGFESSAMDGYAVAAADCLRPNTSGGTRLSVVGSIYAGGGMTGWQPGAAVKVMTGGRIPAGADCVIPWEGTDLGVQEVIVRSPAISGLNIRGADAEIALGQQLLRAGAIVTAQALSALVASGIARISVVRRPRVAVLTTGDELVTAGAGLLDGQVIDSNGPFLKAFVEANGAKVVAVGRVSDDRAPTIDSLRAMAAIADLVVTTGGVSVGEHDWIRGAIEEIGEVGFWKIAMRPGKPMLFGEVDATTVLALPGNPVSVVACCHLFLGLLLDRLAGIVDDRRLVPVSLETAIAGTPGRTTLAPGVVRDGSFRPLAGRHHGLGALAGANGYAVVGERGADAGAEVPFAPSC